MQDFKVGDIVARKSYGGDVYFRVVNIINDGKGKPVYVLRGLLYRLQADSNGEDLEIHDSRAVYSTINRNITSFKRNAATRSPGSRLSLFARLIARNGRILHIDSSEEFLTMCMKHYREANIRCIGIHAEESDQPRRVKQLLERYRTDILVVTGHDSMKKNIGNTNSLSNYTNSGYFIESVKEARKYEPNLDKLCIFAGACQSYYESIMAAGANFASSPGRILINALDPAFVCEKVAVTDSKRYITPQMVAEITISGAKGVSGINTRGHMLL